MDICYDPGFAYVDRQDVFCRDGRQLGMREHAHSRLIFTAGTRSCLLWLDWTCR